MARRTAPPRPLLGCKLRPPRIVIKAHLFTRLQVARHPCRCARGTSGVLQPCDCEGRRLGEEGDASRRSEETSVQYAHSTDATFLKPLRGTNTSLMFSTKAASRKTALMAVWQALAQAS